MSSQDHISRSMSSQAAPKAWPSPPPDRARFVRSLMGTSRLRSWSRMLCGKAQAEDMAGEVSDVQRLHTHRARLSEFQIVFDEIVARIVELDDCTTRHAQRRLHAENQALTTLQGVLLKEETAFHSFHAALSGRSTMFLSKWRMSDEEILYVEAQSLCEVFEDIAQDIKRQQVAISARLIEFPAPS